MGISNKVRTIFRGEVPLAALLRELGRRSALANHRRTERKQIDAIGDAPPRLAQAFSAASEAELLIHFRDRKESVFAINSSDDPSIYLQQNLFPDETDALLRTADRIVSGNSWELAGFGTIKFESPNLWRTDPLGSKDWGMEYHADVVVDNQDGADIRVLWELNRFGHVIPLALAYALTGREDHAETFFRHVEEWMRQNRYGRGPNWNCAMEVALRAINLLAAFDIFRLSPSLTQDRLTLLLQLFDQHGRFILNNNEFSYIATSNHYLSNVIGLLWIGMLLPELECAEEWKRLGLREVLSEIDKQVLSDGADFEASTGYHKFVSEMLLVTFVVGRRQGIQFPQEYRAKLGSMLAYLNAMVRPDGRMPLIGDADGSQIVPVIKRDADDVAYLLALGAAALEKPELKAGSQLSPEVLWYLGEHGIDTFNSLDTDIGLPTSAAFRKAGSYVMRHSNLNLHLNTNDCGLNGRGSHGHNDALSIEISAYGRPFIIDPGSYVYNLDRDARHTFRSTAVHSTVMVDGAEQNTTDRDLPFVLGNEAQPRVLEWESGAERDRIVAEHLGYMRLTQPVRHQRMVEFYKEEGYWVIEDSLSGEGDHDVCFSFHLAPGSSISEIDDCTVHIHDESEASLYIRAVGLDRPSQIAAFVSRNYGHREPSTILKWELNVAVPFAARFILVPCAGVENRAATLELISEVSAKLNN